MMGGLMWVDNTWAYIGGGQTEDAIPLESLLDGLDYEEIQQFDADGDGMIPLAGGVLLRCNGDQDDNKEERVIIQLLAGETVSPFFSKSATNYDERRTVTAYKDFGHLKVMPASDEVISNIYILL